MRITAGIIVAGLALALALKLPGTARGQQPGPTTTSTPTTAPTTAPTSLRVQLSDEPAQVGRRYHVTIGLTNGTANELVFDRPVNSFAEHDFNLQRDVTISGAFLILLVEPPSPATANVDGSFWIPYTKPVTIVPGATGQVDGYLAPWTLRATGKNKVRAMLVIDRKKIAESPAVELEVREAEMPKQSQ